MVAPLGPIRPTPGVQRAGEAGQVPPTGADFGAELDKAWFQAPNAIAGLVEASTIELEYVIPIPDAAADYQQFVGVVCGQIDGQGQVLFDASLSATPINLLYGGV